MDGEANQCVARWQAFIYSTVPDGQSVADPPIVPRQGGWPDGGLMVAVFCNAGPAPWTWTEGGGGLDVRRTSEVE